jgi:hypothetical protein
VLAELLKNTGRLLVKAKPRVLEELGVFVIQTITLMLRKHKNAGEVGGDFDMRVTGTG